MDALGNYRLYGKRKDVTRRGWQDGDNVGRGNIIREGAAVGAID